MKPIGIIACGAIVRELCHVMQRLDWPFELTAVPAQLHNRPEKIAPAVQRKLDGWAARFDVILVGYADCGTRGALDALLARYPHAVRIQGAHCYEFFGGERFRSQSIDHPGTFYLTDFLARHFDRLVWHGLGLDRFPELQSIYFGNYTEVLYLRQSHTYNEEQKASAAATRLNLPFQIADTGLDGFQEQVVQAVQSVRRGKQQGTLCAE